MEQSHSLNVVTIWKTIFHAAFPCGLYRFSGGKLSRIWWGRSVL